MEIKINITQYNKERVLDLISELVDNEYDKNAGADLQTISSALKQSVGLGLGVPENFDSKLLTKPKLEESEVGSWFMFNSFFAGKALLRILANLINKEQISSVSTDTLVQVGSDAFKKAGLSKYRGFPKEKKHHKYEKSNIDKLKYFILKPFADMGLIVINSDDTHNQVSLTKPGLDFVMLDNPILDEHKQSPSLSEAEQRFILGYIKSIDSKYKEYSTLKETVDFIKTKKNISYPEIVDFFVKNEKIANYLYNGSRAQKENKSKDDKNFKIYLSHAAYSFASSRIALLRELGILSDKRGEYKIVSEVF